MERLKSDRGQGWAMTKQRVGKGAHSSYLKRAGQIDNKTRSKDESKDMEAGKQERYRFLECYGLRR